VSDSDLKGQMEIIDTSNTQTILSAPQIQQQLNQDAAAVIPSNLINV